MELNELTAIGPMDGRYRKQLNILSPYFSEYGLMKYRLKIEILYLLLLARENIFSFPKNINENVLFDIHVSFSMKDAIEIKEIERITNHDIKAIEYFLKKKLLDMGGDEIVEFVHFGLTSQDISSVALSSLWHEALSMEYIPTLYRLKERMEKCAEKWKNVPMLSYTHGQPATPTTVSKEFMVFVERMDMQLSLLNNIPFSAKFGGATGNFNAHFAAYKHIDWQKITGDWMWQSFGCIRSKYTTQIDHYDNLAAQFDALKRINTILIDFSRDIWQYISMGYFKLKIKETEIGSSTMPHKVNPIDFENGEGNLGIANALYEHLSAKLPISRLQRDLTDSTVLRNIGVPFSHSYLAFLSIEKGLDKLSLDIDKLDIDLNNNWVVVSEAIQTILRRERYPKPYEALKELTRGITINKESLHKFIDNLVVSTEIKEELKAITPHNYIGRSVNL